MDKESLQHKEYIGDSVYVGHDGYHVWLYTDNGLEVTNQIALEPEVLKSLDSWLSRLNPDRRNPK